MYICKYCLKQFKTKNALNPHIHRAHIKPGISYGGKKKGSIAWNKGLTKETDKRVLQNTISIRKYTNTLKGKPGKKHSLESKLKISKSLSSNNRGGKCKWYNVSGQMVQGTWERNIAEKFNELQIKWIKLKTNKDTFPYFMDDKIKHYTPDFYLPEYNVYLEIKGYWWGRDKEKMDEILIQHYDKNIIIIEKDKYKRIMLGEQVW